MSYNVTLDEDAVNAVLEALQYEGELLSKFEEYIDVKEYILENLGPGDIIDYVADNDFFDDIAEAACDSGTERMIEAFMSTSMDYVLEALRCDDFVQAINNPDNELAAMLKNAILDYKED